MTLNVKRLDDIDMVELPEILARTEMPDTVPLWDDLKKARLIDSILNNIPIGQIFLMRQPRQIVSPDGWLQEFFVIDGYERLNAIADFIDGKLLLESDFEFFENEFVQAHGMSFIELNENFPFLAKRFWRYPLDIKVVEASSRIEIVRMLGRQGITTDRHGRERCELSAFSQREIID